MNSSEQLQIALYSILSTQYPTFEVLPDEGVMPYILIGDEQVTRNDTKNSKRSIHSLTIHAYSKGNTSLLDKKMKFFIQKQIETNLVVSGFSVEMIELEMVSNSNKTEGSGKSTIFHAIVEYRITLTEKE